MVTFGLQFRCEDLAALSAAYDYGGDGYIGRLIKEEAESGAVSAPVFLRLVQWKTSGRSVPLARRNSPEAIERATRVALAPKSSERERVGALVALEGVGYPVASTLLHFGHADPYPILDRRALEAAGYKSQRTVYTFSFWWDYVVFCRRTARECGISMRALDRAMWQWSNARTAES